MIGGHFNYGSFRVSQFADELQHELDTKSQYHSDKVWNELERIQRVIEIAGKYAKQTEWLFSENNCDETFLDQINKIDENWRRQ